MGGAPDIAIDDAIARVIGEFPVTALNCLPAPLELATDRDLVGLESDEFQALVDARRADFEADRPDDGVVLRILTLHWIGRGLTEPEAQCKATWQLAAMYHKEEMRLQARPGGWVRLPPPPARLRRDEVEMALGEMLDKEWHQGRIDIWPMAADRSAMLPPVPRSTTLQLRQVLLTREWVIASRDRVDDPQPIVGLHITEAGLEALMNAVRSRLGEKPPRWPLLLTPDELEKRRKARGIAPKRLDYIASLYKKRLEPLTSAPKYEWRNKRDDPELYDLEWAKKMKIDRRRELPLLRQMYIPRRKSREA
jgi:hypothetical protein